MHGDNTIAGLFKDRVEWFATTVLSRYHSQVMEEPLVPPLHYVNPWLHDHMKQ